VWAGGWGVWLGVGAVLHGAKSEDAAL